MTRYLETLIAQARGAEPQIRPRLRSRFEPESPEASAEISEDFAPAEKVETAIQPTLPEVRGAPQAEIANTLAGSPEKPSAEPAHEIVRHIHQHTERLEHTERHIIEQAAPPVAHVAAPERTVIVERLQEVPSSGEAKTPPEFRDPVRTSPTEAPLKSQPVRPEDQLAKTVPVPSPGSWDETAASTTRPTSLSVSTEIASTRSEYPALPEAPDPPEITISIGVLDIRLTQEPPADRRPPARAQERRDNPLPLADYLAKRSGSAS